jgi:hypothetical protein
LIRGLMTDDEWAYFEPFLIHLGGRPPQMAPTELIYINEAVLFEPLASRRKSVMKGWSVIGLLFAAAMLATAPVSPQVTPRGVELTVDQAQAVTYGRYRRTTRRVARRDYRQTRRAVRRCATGVTC